jgi:fructan beta-fructosidase
MKQVNPLFFLLFFLSIIGCQMKESVGDPVDEAGHDYQEPHRPQFHFSPDSAWMNDPNGMVYYKGEYHLHYQYYPDSTVWGPMHWGHAVSKDLIHWEHLPIALYPDSLGYIFSGSAVVDWNNTSGLGENGVPPLIAIFTHHDTLKLNRGRVDFQYQSIAYSNDQGRTWTKYEGNPVLPNPGSRDFRDPKVIWDEGARQWIMVFAEWDHVKFYGSPDLINWTFLSDFGEDWGSHGGVWECPDLFSMKVAGSDETKWVLLLSINPGGPNGGSATQYFIGDFDGKTFTLDPDFAAELESEEADTTEKAIWLDYGRDNYAGVTWSDIPQEDGRRIFIGWMSNWDYANRVPTHPHWRSAMTLPRTLELHRIGGVFRLTSRPVEELKNLRTASYSISPGPVTADLQLSEQLGVEGPLLELELELTLVEGENTVFGIQMMNEKGEHYTLYYNSATAEFYSDRTEAGKKGFSDQFAEEQHEAPRMSKSKSVKLHLFFDKASVELFADDGATVMTEIFFPTADFTQLSLVVEKGAVNIQAGTVYELEGIW